MSTALQSLQRIGTTQDNNSIIIISSELEQHFNQFITLYPTLRPEIEDQWKDNEYVTAGSSKEELESFFDSL